jgi:hypothetical protein
MANKDNPKRGAEFEDAVARYLITLGVSTKFSYPISIGVGATKRDHRFDLGVDNPKVVMECKAHTWTEGNKRPVQKWRRGTKPCIIFHSSRMITARCFLSLRTVATQTAQRSRPTTSVANRILSLTVSRFGSSILGQPDTSIHN